MQRSVLQGQSLLDISLECFGTIEAVFDIARLNNKSITQRLEPGEVLNLPAKDYGYKEIVNYYRQNKIQPATAHSTSSSANLLNDFLLPQVLPTL